MLSTVLRTTHIAWLQLVPCLTPNWLQDVVNSDWDLLSIQCSKTLDIIGLMLKASMVHSVSGWMRGVQVKLWDPLRTCVIPECLRDVFTTRRYKNTRLPYLTLPDGYTPKIVAGKCFVATLAKLGNRNNIAKSKSNWYIGAY